MRVPDKGPTVSRWGERDDGRRGAEYDRRWQEMEQAGESIHGEADLIDSFGPVTVLDAGCGTGRVAVELARRGIDVIGIDLDERMLAVARQKAPELTWLHADLAGVDIVGPDGALRRFDVVAMPGNVMIFVEPGREAAVVANLARHLAPEGRLVAGFQLGGDRLGLDHYDEYAAAAGLSLEARWATWDRAPFAGGGYAVSVHRSV